MKFKANIRLLTEDRTTKTLIALSPRILFHFSEDASDVWIADSDQTTDLHIGEIPVDIELPKKHYLSKKIKIGDSFTLWSDEDQTGFGYVTEIIKEVVSEPQNTFRNRRGQIHFSKEMIFENPSAEELKLIFTNFFPVSIVQDHRTVFYNTVVMYGLSPHFREIEETEPIPEYQIYFKLDELGTHFDRIEEIVN